MIPLVTRVGRRTWLKSTAALAGGVTECARGAAPQISSGAGQAAIIASASNAVVDTTAGRVRGYTRNGIFTFKGIPYAGPTGGSARFLPPTKPKPWTGMRSSMSYGPVCPQAPFAFFSADDENAFLFELDNGQQNEDCLRVNIWTPGITNTRKRPVMVWIHGGSYLAGSGHHLNAYDGENLSRRGDVVVVSLNHRLNVLGYANLAEYGEKYASSANVGQLDLVEALEWIRDNIANFGGDAGNVTIFGQSGGGLKIGALMAMPAAKGLFHRAIIQSGSGPRGTGLREATPDSTGRLASALLSELGLSRSQVDELQNVPVSRLMEAQVRARARAASQGSVPDRGPAWRPTVDGKILPNHPFDPVAPI
ncbi:MAG: carboxylesterase/lipase family protein, partial [Bryobacteraceae bacterium]